MHMPKSCTRRHASVTNAAHIAHRECRCQTADDSQQIHSIGSWHLGMWLRTLPLRRQAACNSAAGSQGPLCSLNPQPWHPLRPHVGQGSCEGRSTHIVPFTRAHAPLNESAGTTSVLPFRLALGRCCCVVGCPAASGAPADAAAPGRPPLLEVTAAVASAGGPDPVHTTQATFPRSIGGAPRLLWYNGQSDSDLQHR